MRQSAAAVLARDDFARDLTGSTRVDVDTPGIDAEIVRRVIRRRRVRDRVLGTELFSDPAWDMMLDLSAAHAEGRELSVTSLCLATPTPATTALRWLERLGASGIIERVADPKDRRRVLVRLTPEGQRRMALCIQLMERS